MYKRILIANRTDCALRLIRSCHELGIQAFVISARDDANEMLRQSADGLVYTGLSRDAYLSEANILEAARHFGCEAVLPGWGFLSENAAFAQSCRLAGCHFIGPTNRQLQLFGDKLQTIALLQKAFPEPHPSIPCDSQRMTEMLEQMSGPFMLKNRFGGGGKDIFLYKNLSELLAKLNTLRISGTLRNYYIEKACVGPGVRHIEFQFFGDGKGNVYFLGARDCTPQIHHQKYLEKTIDITQSSQMTEICSRVQDILQKMHYQSWGTVECLYAEDGKCQLLELNPRLQVEHGVTEMIQNVDLVCKAAIAST